MLPWRAKDEGSSLPVRPVSVRERFRIMQWIRVVAAALVLLLVVSADRLMQPYPEQLAVLTLGLVCVAAINGLLVAVHPHRVLSVSRALLVVDALWFVEGASLTGGVGSPVTYALLLHLGAVTCLASWRTGVTLAVVDTGLLVTSRVLGAQGWSDRAVPDGRLETQRLVVFVVVLWLVALSTSALSIVNERELRRRRRDLEALSALTTRVESSADSVAVAGTLLDAVVGSYDLRRGVVLASPEGTLPLLASHGLDPDLVPGRPGPSAVVTEAQRARETVLVRRLEPEADAWLLRLLPDAGPLLVVPLSADERPIGALVVEHLGRPRSHKRIVTALERSASYGALALRNAWLLERVQRLAATDPLTKIANRRTFEQTLERELARATRADEHVSLVLVDLDHFKRLNDGLGHQAGDEVLRNAAAALACECREFDTPARYGGEEFAVILPGCGPEQAEQIAERLREAVGAAPNVVAVTASAGVATYPSHAADSESLVRAADAALYAAKRAGRDQTCVSPGLPPEEHVNALVRKALRDRMRAQEADGGTGVPAQPTLGLPPRVDGTPAT
jgi:diguanylate cyclase (GGDEF)-like protein